MSSLLTEVKRCPLSFLLVALLIVLVLPGSPGPADAQAGESSGERITSWHSEVEVLADGTIDVREKITVQSTGETIKHGIMRDFPVRFTDWQGQRRTASFELLSVARNGQIEPYELVPIENGVQVRIGSAKVRLSPGDHSYVLHYRSANQLYFLDDTDLIYWNVTGNEWELPIDEASCTVRFPRELKRDEVKLECWTGISGSELRNAEMSFAAGAAEFKTTAPLPSGWGLTIAVHFPRGLVDAPSGMARPEVNGVAALAEDTDVVKREDSTSSLPKWVTESWPVLILLAWLVFAGLRGGGGGSGPDSGYRAHRDITYRSSGSSSSSFRGRSGGGGGGGGGRGW